MIFCITLLYLLPLEFQSAFFFKKEGVIEIERKNRKEIKYSKREWRTEACTPHRNKGHISAGFRFPLFLNCVVTVKHFEGVQIIAPKTLISLNRWLRRKFQGNHPLKSITMNNSFQHSQQEQDKSQAIWGSDRQHNKQSSSPSSSSEGSVPGIHGKGNRQRRSRKARAALCMA